MELHAAELETLNMNSSRRNGKPASCEPCRLNKTRCDHTYPKCDRCHQRGIPDQCFYHPAPLTKRRGAEEYAQQDADPGPPKKKRSRPRKSRSRLDAEQSFFATPALSQEDAIADPVAIQSHRPGYLGPTSYAAILPTENGTPLLGERESSVDSQEESNVGFSQQHMFNKSLREQMTSEVLRSLRLFPRMLELVKLYCLNNQAGYVPAPLVNSAVQALQETVDKWKLMSSAPDPRLVAMVLENTSKPLNIPPTISAKDFYKLVTGDNLRLEIIAVLFATAGRSNFFGLAADSWNEVHRRSNKPAFTQEMLRSSRTCLTLCFDLSPVNDVLVWMFYENFLLTNIINGYTGPPTWRRLGELATMIYALGIHKESSGSNLPAFILETRRRIFCSAYTADKTVSTFLGRPLRLSKRHTDIKLPLDISDEDLTSDETTFKIACRSLGEDGWNLEGRYYRASWNRLRYLSSQFREEILDLALSKVDAQVEQQLLDISNRSRMSWEALPTHLRYWSECWESELPSGVCLMLTISYLTYLYNEFMIQKLLDRPPLTLNVPLLRVSMDLLSTGLTLGAVRDRTYDVHRDFLHVILLHGIPSGSVLATALQEQSRTSQPFPPSISRSEIIRTLSVLISHLDGASGSLKTENPRHHRDGNYNLCRKAAKTFTRVIDAVLDPKEVERTPTSGTEFGSLEFELGMLGAPTLEGLDGLEGGVGELWEGFDWGGVGQWAL